MPEKSVREMNAVEKMHHSLAAKIFRATVTGCILLGLVTLIVGLGLYTYTLSGQIIRHAFDLTRSAAGTAAISFSGALDAAGFSASAAVAAISCGAAPFRIIRQSLGSAASGIPAMQSPGATS